MFREHCIGGGSIVRGEGERSAPAESHNWDWLGVEGEVTGIAG